jgi:2-keto-4-pentenoate hydratase/2-oxohepta-3-ene-1,7-dioic acid hydratase in catechol pathway
MKLCRYGPVGAERPGLVDATGTLRDLSGHIADIGPDAIGREALEALARLDPDALSPVPGNPRLGACVTGTRQFIAIGTNYADHAAGPACRCPTSRWFSRSG